MLALHPELCDMAAIKTVVCPPNEEPMMNVRGVYRWQSFADYTPTGVLGVPAAATAEKGELMFGVQLRIYHPRFYSHFLADFG